MKPLDLPPDWGVSRETTERLRAYHALLLKWQDKINLISPGTVPDAWERHFVDSAQLAPLLPGGVKSLYDLGSGAGFPGLVLAILRPELTVTLIESDSKKCAFLQTVSRETGVAVTVRNERIEQAATALPAPDIITARALASLPELLALCHPWLEGGRAVLLFPKGRRHEDEVARARAAGWDFALTETPSVTDKEASLLVLSPARQAQT